jgi:peptidyl-prolyl cis-trans isomerase B (cyclophilin B)
VTVRAYAARGLAKQRDPQALGLLLKAVDDKDYRVRIAVVRALGAFADSAALPQVLGGLLDKEPTVRETAAAAAAQLRSRDAAPALRKGLSIRMRRCGWRARGPGRAARGRGLAGLARPARRSAAVGAARDDRALGTMHAEEPRPGPAEGRGRAQAGGRQRDVRGAGRRVLGPGGGAEPYGAGGDRLGPARRQLAGRGPRRPSGRGRAGDSTLAGELARLARHNPDPRETDVPLAAFAALEIARQGRGIGRGRRRQRAGGAARGFAAAEPGCGRPRTARTGRCSGDGPRPGASAHPAPAWKGAALADYRAQLAREDEDGELGASPARPSTPCAATSSFASTVREAPLTVANFVTLAEKGYYNDVIWHRVVPYFVAQDGDPTGTGSGGPGYSFRCEYDGCATTRARWAWRSRARTRAARSTSSRSRRSRTSTGAITIFGHVVKGQDVAERIRRGDRITSIRSAA